MSSNGTIAGIGPKGEKTQTTEEKLPKGSRGRNSARSDGWPSLARRPIDVL